MCTTARPKLANNVFLHVFYTLERIIKLVKRTQLDDESDSAHDAEADANSLAQLEKLLLVG